MTIPTIPQVSETVRPLNERLWLLHRKCAEGSATADEIEELDAMCAVLEEGEEG